MFYRERYLILEFPHLAHENMCVIEEFLELCGVFVVYQLSFHLTSGQVEIKITLKRLSTGALNVRTAGAH